IMAFKYYVQASNCQEAKLTDNQASLKEFKSKLSEKADWFDLSHYYCQQTLVLETSVKHEIEQLKQSEQASSHDADELIRKIKTKVNNSEELNRDLKNECEKLRIISSNLAAKVEDVEAIKKELHVKRQELHITTQRLSDLETIKEIIKNLYKGIYIG